MEDERKCPECQRTVHGRIDKKFCSDACRNAHNNKSNAVSTNYVRKVNNTLLKNRRILADMNPNGKIKKHRDQLLKKGFDFDFYTNSYVTKAGDVYRFCYEQGYLILDAGFILLVERNNDKA